METKDGKYDRERDPEVIARRTELFNKYIATRLPFIDYLCAKYIVNKNWDTFAEIRDLCLINLYRYIETYDPSKYTGKKQDKNLENWIHIVCKRFIYNYEKGIWERENSTKDNIDVSEAIDLDDILIDTENSQSYITMDNWRDEVSDEVLEAFEKLTDVQRESFILRYQGYIIPEIQKKHVENGLLSNKPGCDVIKKIMQKGRMILEENLRKHDRGSSEPGGKTDDEGLQPYNPEDEFKLELRTPRKPRSSKSI